MGALKGNTGLAGARGAASSSGPRGREGPRGRKGSRGKQGEPGTARAYAYITGTREVSHAKNLGPGNVVHAGTSQPHIKGQHTGKCRGYVTIAASKNLIISAGVCPGGVCPVGTQVTIVTCNTEGSRIAGDVEVMLN